MTTAWSRGREILGLDFQIQPLDLARDYPGIDRLLEHEEWPFTRDDLEVSHAQPQSVGYVARRDVELLGFFLSHHFGDIAYLDMMIVAPDARVSHVARKLYRTTMRALKQRGMEDCVAHSTNDSFRIFQFLQFRRGPSFTLLARDPIAPDETRRGDARTANELESSGIKRLTAEDASQLIALDAEVFGMHRPDWIRALLGQPSASFYGTFGSSGRLVASLCLRARKSNAICIDAVNAHADEARRELVDAVIAAHPANRLECFALDGSQLDPLLRERGFSVPDFFVDIGPLVEWRRGSLDGLVETGHTQCLSWF